MIGAKRRSRAGSDSTWRRYSSSVVAPTTWRSPRARAGLRMSAPSIVPRCPRRRRPACAARRGTARRGGRRDDLVDQPPQALLELAAVLRAGDQAGEVDGHDAAVGGPGDAAPATRGRSPRRWPSCRRPVTDEHGVVGAPTQDLEHGRHLAVAPDDGVEAARRGRRRSGRCRTGRGSVCAGRCRWCGGPSARGRGFLLTERTAEAGRSPRPARPTSSSRGFDHSQWALDGRRRSPHPSCPWSGAAISRRARRRGRRAGCARGRRTRRTRDW